jgi:hypothetical protein
VGGNPVLVQGAVAPGQTYDVYATLTTPYAEGVYRSFWALQNPENNNVGERIWAEFEVVSQESATPQSEAPQIYSFVVSPFQILSGSCVNVSWSYGGEGVMSSRLFRNGEKILFDIPLSGSYSDCPTQDGYNEYRLIIDSDNYGSTTALQFVDVIPGPQPTIAPQPTLTPTRTESPPGSAPVIDYFTSDAVIIRVGECVDLHWSFSGDSLSNTRLYRDHILLADRLYSPGTLNDCPLLPGRIEYRLIVDSSCCGSTEKSLYISVHHFSITPIKKIDE